MWKQIIGSISAFVLTSQALSYPELLQSRPDLSKWSSFVQNDSFLLDLFSPSSQKITCFAANDSTVGRFQEDPSVAASFQRPAFIRIPITYSCFHGLYNSSFFTSEPLFLRSLLNESTTIKNVTQGVVSARGAPIEMVRYDNGTIAAVGFPIAARTPALIHPGERLQSWIVESDIEFDNGILHIVDNLYGAPTSVTLAYVGKVYQNEAILDLNSTGYINSSLNYEEATYFIPQQGSVYEELKKLSTDQFNAVGRYSRIPNYSVFTDSFSEAGTNITVDGLPMTLSKREGDYYVNDCRISVPNAFIINGAVHLMDNCYLVPPGSDVPPPAA